MPVCAFPQSSNKFMSVSYSVPKFSISGTSLKQGQFLPGICGSSQMPGIVYYLSLHMVPKIRSIALTTALAKMRPGHCR